MNEPNKTIPWNESELMTIFGHKLWYTTDSSDKIMSVKLPGGRSINISKFKKSSKIKPPTHVRINRETNPELLQEHYDLTTEDLVCSR